MTEMFTHLGRPGGTVQTDHVDTEWLECRQRRTDLTAQEHRSGCLDRHVRDDRQPQSELLHRTLAAEDCSFHLKQVLAGFDEDGVGATVDHAERSFGVRVTQDCVRCVSQAGGELGSRSHRAEYESGHAVAAWSHLVRYFTGESSAFFREFADPVRDVVVGEVGQVATEGVGLDGIGTSGEVRTVDVFEHVGTGVVEDLIAPPSRPRKSSRVRSAACNMVPIAPSPMTTRCFSASSRAELNGADMPSRVVAHRQALAVGWVGESK